MFDDVKDKFEKVISGVSIPVTSTNNGFFEVTVGTNGPKGGDTGHGGRTYFSIEDYPGDMDICCELIGEEYTYGDDFYNEDVVKRKGVQISLGGDIELESFIESLEFAVAELKKSLNDEEKGEE